MAGIDKIFSLGKRILMKNADDLLKVRPQEKIEVFKDLVVKQADGMTLWSALDKKAPHVNQSPGRIIDMMKKKSYTLKHTSTPTQKYIDDALGVAKTERASEITKNGHGYVNSKRVADAKYAFEHNVRQTEPVPVKLESRYTKDVIEDMYGARMKAADDYLRAESIGAPFSEAVMKRREDAFEAFSKMPDSGYYGSTAKTLKEVLETSKGGDGSLDISEALECLMVTPKGREYNNARCELIKMIDKVRKSGGEIKVSKHVVEAAEIDQALTARITKFVDGPMGRFEDLDQAIMKRFGLKL